MSPAKQVHLADGGVLGYDYCAVATGARHSYFGHDEWEPLAPGLKSIEDALEIRRRIFLAFERAEREPDLRSAASSCSPSSSSVVVRPASKSPARWQKFVASRWPATSDTSIRARRR